MSIDRIGKSVGAAATPGAVAPDAVAGAEPFQVDRAANVGAAQGVTPLERLQTGEIDLNQYLDLRIQQATSHLEGKLSAERLSFIRESLRAQLETDPMLVELVSKAAGPAFEKPSHGG